jgi:hypothetical protein
MRFWLIHLGFLKKTLYLSILIKAGARSIRPKLYRSNSERITKGMTPQKLWRLTRTEYCGQCTGFSSETTWLAVFTKKPDLKTLAPFIGKYLSDDMGVAIGQVQSLIDTGFIALLNNDFELETFETDKLLSTEYDQ